MTTIMKTVFEVRGMTCGSCVRRVAGALKGVAGVAAVHVDPRSDKVTVDHGTEASPEALLGALAEAGYPGRAVA